MNDMKQWLIEVNQVWMECACLTCLGWLIAVEALERGGD